MNWQRRPQTATRWFFFTLLIVSLAACGTTPASPTAQPAPTSAPAIAPTAAPTQPPPTEAAPTQAPPTAAPTEAAPTQAPATQPAAAGAESTITIVIPEDPPSFDPIINDTGYDALVKNMVLLGLTGIDADGKIYPQLAAELPTEANGDVVINQDKSTMDVTWKLRTDVNWADGEPVTADDVVFTYQAITDPKNGTWTEGLDYVTGMDKVDDHTVVIHFNAIYPSYQTFFGGVHGAIWPKHYCKADQGFIAWDCARTPLSDGPYMLKDWVAGDHLTLVKNPKYYQAGKPQIDKIIVKTVPDAAVRETMLKQGDADVIMWTTEQIVNDLAADPNVKVSVAPTSRFVMRLFMNLAAKGSTDPDKNPNPFLKDVRVRQAIRMAIDVDAISKAVWHGYGAPVWTEFHRPPYQCDIARPKYDPEAAKALLEKAGWTDPKGTGVRECHGCQNAKAGEQMKMDLNIYSEYGEPLQLTQQLIGEMLGKVGIQVELSSIQGSVMWADSASGGTEQTGNFNIDLYDDGYKGTDPAPYLRQYYSSASAVPDQGWNVGRWKNAEFDALLEQTNTLDEQKRKEVFCQMAKILDNEVPEILLFATINADAYSTRLAGIQSNINDVVSWNIADWTLTK